MSEIVEVVSYLKQVYATKNEDVFIIADFKQLGSVVEKVI